MNYSLLGKTELKISSLGLGCWVFAGDKYWGSQAEADSISTMLNAVEAGINFFDTAEMYGDGKSEEVVGKALEDRRSKVVIASKAASANLSAEKLVEAGRHREKGRIFNTKKAKSTKRSDVIFILHYAFFILH